ncbi:uncharacterized protein LOC111716013, partial [Eurytemora carolleeae]|uniref:uncharacterized protein LOC111716013 n=1 Tax=Eurytemora carolleeae TaxID=1294199 RepID=UPI000C760011
MFTLRGALSQLCTHRAARTGFCVLTNAGNYRFLVRVNDVAEQSQRSISGRKYSNSFKTNFKPNVKSTADLAKSSKTTNAKFNLSPEDEKILSDVFRDRFSRDRFILSEEWAEIKSSVIGLPFAPGRLVSNINVNNAILKYCGQMDRIIIIKSFSEYLEKLGNQSLYIFPLLQAIVNTGDIKGEDGFVSEVSNKILEVGFDNSISEHYWAALRALIKTQYWRKGLELARTTGWEGYNDNRHDSHQPSVQTFTDLAVKALEQGEEELMWDIMKESLFHGNDMPLRYPEAGGHKIRETLYNKWIEHCASLENPKLGLEKLFNYFQQFDVHPTPSTCRKLQEVYSGLPDSRLSNTQLDHYKGSCFCCDTVLDPSSVTADELKHLNQSILHHLLKRKVRVASTSKLVFILSFFGPCQLFKINYKGPELFARGEREYL